MLCLPLRHVLLNEVRQPLVDLKNTILEQLSFTAYWTAVTCLKVLTDTVVTEPVSTTQDNRVDKDFQTDRACEIFAFCTFWTFRTEAQGHHLCLDNQLP
jgi:hypothetical protein